MTRDPAQAGGAALAYAAAACRRRADDPVRRRRHGAARRRAAAARPARSPGATAASFVGRPPGRPAEEAGFAVPCDLVASAFVLLACWDEHTTARARQARPPALRGQHLRDPAGPAHRGPGRRPLRRGAARRPGSAARGPRPRAAARSGGPVGRAADASPSPSRTTWTTCGAGRGVASRPPATARSAPPGRGAPRAWAVSSATSATGSSVTCPAAPTRSGRSRRSSTARTAAASPPPSSSSRATRTSATATSRRRTGQGSPRPCACSPATGARSACTATTPTVSASTPLARRPRPAREAGASRDPRHALPLPALPLPRDAAVARAGRLQLRHQPRVRRARGLPLRLLVPLPPVLPGRGAAARPRRAAARRDGRHPAGAALPQPRGGAGRVGGATGALPRPAQRRRGQPALAQQPLRPARLARLRQGLLAARRPALLDAAPCSTAPATSSPAGGRRGAA